MVSFCVGLILLILNQYGFLMDDYQRKKYEKKQAKLAKQQMKNNGINGSINVTAKTKNGTEINIQNGDIEFISSHPSANLDDISFHHVEQYTFDENVRNENNEVVLDENGEPKTRKKKAMIIFAQFKNKRISDQYKNGLKSIQNGKGPGQDINNEDEKEKEEEQIEGADDNNNNKHKNGIHSHLKSHKNGHIHHYLSSRKEQNGKNKNVHRRRMKLMDGTVIKCQCDECKLRREKRREERKKVKILKQMMNGNGKYHLDQYCEDGK